MYTHVRPTSPSVGKLVALRKAHPERLFYLTGHSLGGGVAKLVALMLGANQWRADPRAVSYFGPRDFVQRCA